MKKGNYNFTQILRGFDTDAIYQQEIISGGLTTRCMHQQINQYFESILSKFQCCFRQGVDA